MKMKKMQISKIEEGSRLILEGLGLDLNNEHYKKTPTRMTESISFLLRGIKEKDEAIKELNVTFKESLKTIIVLKNLNGLSLCPHHFLPISYKASFAYVPNGKVVGASKPYKVFKTLAAQPITQEELTTQFIEEFWKKVKPLGCIIKIEGKFFCFEKDGLDSFSSTMVTLNSKGVFSTNKKLEKEFFSLI